MSRLKGTGHSGRSGAIADPGCPGSSEAFPVPDAAIRAQSEVLFRTSARKLPLGSDALPARPREGTGGDRYPRGGFGSVERYAERAAAVCGDPEQGRSVRRPDKGSAIKGPGRNRNARVRRDIDYHGSALPREIPLEVGDRGKTPATSSAATWSRTAAATGSGRSWSDRQHIRVQRDARQRKDPRHRRRRPR
jgi:hypothetical protein